MAIVDDILKRYEMMWELHPYRIINKHGVVVQKRCFDLREETLKAQENRVKSFHKFQKGYPSTTDNI